MSDVSAFNAMGGSLVLMAPGAALLGASGDAATIAAFGDGSPGCAPETVHRAARLFVAGEYPDKGCAVTEDDLDGIVARFYAGGASVPVKTEHTDSPLDPLGEVVGLYRRGPELFGMLCFSPGVHAHIEARGAGNLSVALTREPKEDGGGYRLTEASLVFRGRVPGAGFLSPEQVAAKVAAFQAAGKLTPAMEPHVARLLGAAASVQFSDGSSGDVCAETLALLAALPVVQPRGLTGAVPAIPFGAPGGGVSSPSAATMAMAESLGVDPARLHEQLAMGF